MPPRVNSEGVYTDEGTIDHLGQPIPYTPEELERTRAYEAEHGIASTLPAEHVVAADDVQPAGEVVVTDDGDDEDEGAE